MLYFFSRETHSPDFTIRFLNHNPRIFFRNVIKSRKTCSDHVDLAYLGFLAVYGAHVNGFSWEIAATGARSSLLKDPRDAKDEKKK